MTRDPIGFGGGDTNLYGYTANDPINSIDVNGQGKIGIAVAAICLAYDTYSTASSIHEINTAVAAALANIQALKRQQNNGLSCPTDIDNQIAAAQESYVKLLSQQAAANGKSSAVGIVLGAICGGLGAISK
jgi:uncharacterized protein RhaS with RHS repeats